MSNNNEKQSGLSPIQESSDLDLSFIISQLSSVSGNITDRTLEELLRDAECQPPSLSWCRQKELSKPDSPPVIASTNMFKTAIDTLSEISTRVQEKLTLDEGSDQAATYRLATSARSKSTLSSKSDKITVDPKSLSSNSPLQKLPKRCTSQFTMNAAARIYGKKLTTAKQSKVQPMFVPSSSKPVKVTVTAGCNKTKGMLSTGNVCQNENKNVRDLWEENARLHSQIENIKAQLSLQSFPPSTPKKEAVHPDAVVVEQLRQFEAKLSSIRETYQVQLDKFNQKFEEFEKLHQKPAINDVQVQTDLEKGGNTNKTEVPSLDFDDLVLDSNLPSSHPVTAGAEISAKSHKADKMTDVRSCRSCSGFGIRGQKNLLNTIRKLQTELDMVKNVNKRLEVQLKSSKSRNFGRSVIKRQIGTQTIGLGACSPQKRDAAVLEPSNNLVTENEDLRKKVETLLKEVEILKEKKVMSLRLLQVKHEEEIEILLEEKMQLSKKLDAVQNWNPCIGKFPY